MKAIDLELKCESHVKCELKFGNKKFHKATDLDFEGNKTLGILLIESFSVHILHLHARTWLK